MEEAEIASVLKQWAKPNEAFREELLQCCLDVLGQEDSAELDDHVLELISAAGDPFCTVDIPNDDSTFPR